MEEKIGKELISKVKEKREFSGLPDSVVLRALKKSDGDVKGARKWLRKYFGVFLTNRVLKFGRRGSGVEGREMLGLHISSKKRNYEKFYGRIFESVGDVGSVVDLGCGVNGFSYEFLPNGVSYVGVDAAGQLVESMNFYFKEKGFDARSIVGDLFDLDFVEDVLKGAKRRRVVFLFQVIDALESVEKDFSLKLISLVMKRCDWLVISLPLVSLSGRKRFGVDRKWLADFLNENFEIKKDFEIFGERVLVVGS